MIPGIWAANGIPSDVQLMYSWHPGAVTCIVDYLAANDVYGYKSRHPAAPVIVRFMHPQNWRNDIPATARRHAEYVLSKWPEIKGLDPYIYFCNELNLHYENGDPNPNNQARYETPEFYSDYARWVSMVADIIKQKIPQMKLVTPPFAFGHHEDGAPDDLGEPTEGWAGYDYLAATVKSHFDNVLTFHAYWGHSGGSVANWLYDNLTSTWYAFRWRRLLRLFERRYGIPAKLIIDEAGNFGASDRDFTDQCLYFAQQTLKDPRVLALTFFLWEDPTNHPGNLPNSWVQRCRNLPLHLQRMSVDIPRDEHLIRVRTPEGRVEVLPVEVYLQGVLPAEVYPSWPEASLQANAILARSVAIYRIKKPRAAEYDISDNDQVYRPERRHPRTDMAIEATKGIYLVDSNTGEPFYAHYVSVCGRDVCPYCQGKPGHTSPSNPSGVWENRACQWGTKILAEQGKGAREIALYYYQGVTLSDLYPRKGCRTLIGGKE